MPRAVDDHMQSIREFLYEEGPQTSDVITEHVGLAQSRVIEILGMMKLEGSIDNVYRPAPDGPGRIVYWCFHETPSA